MAWPFQPPPRISNGRAPHALAELTGRGRQADLGELLDRNCRPELMADAIRASRGSMPTSCVQLLLPPEPVPVSTPVLQTKPRVSAGRRPRTREFANPCRQEPPPTARRHALEGLLRRSAAARCGGSFDTREDPRPTTSSPNVLNADVSRADSGRLAGGDPRCASTPRPWRFALYVGGHALLGAVSGDRGHAVQCASDLRFGVRRRSMAHR